MAPDDLTTQTAAHPPLTSLTIGGPVACREGACGHLQRVVIDPIRRVVTDLVVAADHHSEGGHLVPTALVDASANELMLTCTLVEFAALPAAEETQFLGAAAGVWPYGPGQMLFLPYYWLDSGGLGMGVPAPVGPTEISVDRVPAGMVEVRRGERVHATDGDVGRVQGLVVNPSDEHVTHVLLDEGHLWSRKRVGIPITTVVDVRDFVLLNLTTEEVRNLPPFFLDIDAETTRLSR